MTYKAYDEADSYKVRSTEVDCPTCAGHGIIGRAWPMATLNIVKCPTCDGIQKIWVLNG